VRLENVLQIVNDAKCIWADHPDLDAIEALDAVESKITGVHHETRSEGENSE
jgi:hypothetical protein